MSLQPRRIACDKAQECCQPSGCTPPRDYTAQANALAIAAAAHGCKLDGWEYTIARSALWLRTGRRRSALSFLEKARYVIGLHHFVTGNGAGSELYIARTLLDATNYTELGMVVLPGWPHSPRTEQISLSLHTE